jgi:hypothetical protein
MGHSSIKVTFDLYGNLMPGTADEAAALLDAYMRRQIIGSGLPVKPATAQHVENEALDENDGLLSARRVSSRVPA